MFSKFHFKRSTTILPLLLSAVMLAGCNLPSSTPAMPSQVPTALSTSTLPAALNTPIVPTPPVGPTPAPSVTSTAVPDQLVFATGATAGVASGNIQPGQTKSFSLSASQNQPMIVILNSTNNDVYMGIFNPDGGILLDPAKKWNQLQWLLPQTGAYTIELFGGASTENYSLTVKVAALTGFASGSDTVTKTGTTVKGYVISYAVYCMAGQTMTIGLNVPSTTAYLDTFGIASGPQLSATLKANSWSGVLPATEDYIVEVIPTNGVEVGYQLTIQCH